jgi:membrane protein
VLAQTTGSGRAWFSLLFALWSSSSATSGLIDTLNAIYDVKESRPWWKSRLLSVALAIAMGVLLTAALIIVVYGPFILQKIAPGSVTFSIWNVAQWPAAAVLLILALLGLYQFAPDIQGQKLKWLLPGSIVAAVIWMAVSVLFKLYIHHFSDFGLLYGSLGTLIILMFWFYLSGIAILVGGEINAILEDAAAKHRVPGAKRCGQSRLAQRHV